MQIVLALFAKSSYEVSLSGIYANGAAMWEESLVQFPFQSFLLRISSVNVSLIFLLCSGEVWCGEWL